MNKEELRGDDTTVAYCVPGISASAEPSAGDSAAPPVAERQEIRSQILRTKSTLIGSPANTFGATTSVPLAHYKGTVK